MARTIEEFEKEIAETKVTITEAEFLEKVSEAMSLEPIERLMSSNPILMLAFTVFGVELSKVIFHNENGNESEVTE